MLAPLAQGIKPASLRNLINSIDYLTPPATLCAICCTNIPPNPFATSTPFATPSSPPTTVAQTPFGPLLPAPAPPMIALLSPSNSLTISSPVERAQTRAGFVEP